MLLEQRRRAHQQADRRHLPRRRTRARAHEDDQRSQHAERQQRVEIEQDIAIDRRPPGEDERGQQTGPVIPRDLLRQQIDQRGHSGDQQDVEQLDQQTGVHSDDNSDERLGGRGQQGTARRVLLPDIAEERHAPVHHPGYRHLSRMCGRRKPEQVRQSLQDEQGVEGAAWQRGLLIFGAAQYADAYSNCHYYRASQGNRVQWLASNQICRGVSLRRPSFQLHFI